MDIYEAMEKRISCRSYADKVVEPEKLLNITERIEALNKETNLHFQLFGPRSAGQTAIDTAPSVFAGTVYHYIACVGPDSKIGREQLGYYGEQLVLLATQLGLATCWAVTSYNVKTLRYESEPGEVLTSIILLGYEMNRTPTRQWLIRSNYRQRDKTPEQLIDSDTRNIPNWFMDGVKCAIIAPSGINALPVMFGWHNGIVTASMPEAIMPIQDVDLGIGKLHFELGSRKQGTWQWGENGVFAIE